ncbi:MAG TPA: sigma-70 family RNA polymerase sigma factor [Longimicrobiales bacterium]|nr:sigma-70 family RNA polymerase sigma factor [Longimicrobiales bacterium]
MPLNVEALFREHSDALFRYLVRLTGDVELAADATQEAFVRMIELQPEDRQLRAWLYTVATNVAREWARTRDRRRALAVAAQARLAPDPLPTPDELAHAHSQAARIRRALDTLTERDRTILLMREQGFAHREIADAVGTTTRSVGTMIARALDKLTAALNIDPEPTT